MSRPLDELPRVLREPIGATGAEVVVTHAGSDADGLPRARITIWRDDSPLTTDVVRLDRDAERRRLTRAVLREEKSRLEESTRRNGDTPPIGDGSDGASIGEPEAATTGDHAASLTAAEIERALLRTTEALRAVGLPPAETRIPAIRACAPGEKTETGPTSAETGDERPPFIVRDDLAECSDDAQRLLLTRPQHGIYKRARMLVRVVREEAPEAAGLTRPPGAPVIETITVAHLRDRLARPAQWCVPTKEGYRPVIPPKWVPETLLARGDWPFPRLEAVIETPTLRPDGTILDTPGYDPVTCFLYEPNAAFPPVPNEPTPEEIDAAVREVMEPFSEFPFVAGSDRSAALAAVLTLLARPAIGGPTPLFAIRATTPGTGKGLLASTVALIGTGREPTLFAVSREDEEVRKRLLTIGIEGARCILLDNVEGALGSPSLAAALTTSQLTDRLLGTNRLLTVPMEAVWLATGNNIAFRGDLGRRVLPIDLDAKVEFPEDRTFRRRDLTRWVREERPGLVVAALTLLRAFHAAGRLDHGQCPVGSFEAWDALVRAAVLWLGFDDPVAGRARVRTESDADLEALGTVLEAWWSAIGSEPRTLARAIESAFDGAGHQELAAALSGLDPKGDGRRPRARPVGDRFRRWKGRIVGGLVLETEERKEHGAALWRVTRVEEAGGDRESGSQGSQFPAIAVFDRCEYEKGEEEENEEERR